ncbi:hypothetical protein GCM10010977_30720 [Citricoccus zhacaiensis]|uniref:Uncharacterized protein n=1 Tax=Citricoccus zhacaiensis TaxID=489142 RepID=A0ABQ2MC68_9MICC|nr:hypothetical protein [Citricoccus zhacaiensis]GGO49257.1 hypothetical protein GCM10010977_30720 [Citricoccus zhacaiensis]
MTPSTPAPTTGYLGILQFHPAPHWVPESVRPEIELIATLPVDEDTFRPSIVVTVNPFEGSIREFSVKALTGLTSTLRACRIVDVGGWERRSEDRPQDHLGIETDTSLQSRRIEYVHRADNGRLVSGVDHLVLMDGWAVQISTTCALQDRLFLTADLEAMARSVEPAPGGMAPPSAPVTAEPGYDATASAAELEATGLVEDGRLTEVGDLLSATLQESAFRLRLTGTAGGGDHLVQVFGLSDVALMVSQPGFGERVLGGPWEAPGSEHLHVGMVPLSELSARLLAWAGALPAWNLLPTPALIAPAAYDARLAGPTPPPAGADPALTALWDQSWWVWRIEADADGADGFPETTVLATPQRGTYRVGLVPDPVTGEDRVLLWPVESSFLLALVEDLFQAAHFGRAPQLS